MMNWQKRTRLHGFLFVGAITMPTMYMIMDDYRFMAIGWVCVACQGVMVVIAHRELKRVREAANERARKRRTTDD